MSEPPAKLPKICTLPPSFVKQISFPEILKLCEKDDRVTGVIEFYLTLCIDVLLEVLRFGDQRRLTELEAVGRRFHHLVVNWFGKMPFLRLDIRLEPGLIEGLMAFIGSEQKRIPLPYLAKFPPFLRFNEVLLNYDIGLQSLLEKCRLFEDCLESIKPALEDSKKTHFVANTNHNNPWNFSDHTNLVIYLRDKLMPVCNSSRQYAFAIGFGGSDENSATEVISSILQISQVRSCSNVSIKLTVDSAIWLPVENISNWLAPTTDDGIDICGKKEQNRFLLIFSDIIPNAQEMCDHLKEKFIEANRPTNPFTLRIEDVENNIIGEQKLSNQTTNEEFSISPNIKYGD